jgi:hypothetical protein
VVYGDRDERTVRGGGVGVGIEEPATGPTNNLAPAWTRVGDILVNTFNRIDERFDAVDRRFDRVERRLDDVQGQLNRFEVATEARFNRIDAAIERLTAHLIRNEMKEPGRGGSAQ